MDVLVTWQLRSAMRPKGKVVFWYIIFTCLDSFWKQQTETAVVYMIHGVYNYNTKPFPEPDLFDLWESWEDTSPN